MPLGSLPGLSEAVLGRPWTLKTYKNVCVFKLFANAGFGVALDGPLGPILGQSGPKMDPKISPKVVRKLFNKWSKT